MHIFLASLQTSRVKSICQSYLCYPPIDILTLESRPLMLSFITVQAIFLVLLTLFPNLMCLPSLPHQHFSRVFSYVLFSVRQSLFFLLWRTSDKIAIYDPLLSPIQPLSSSITRLNLFI